MILKTSLKYKNFKRLKERIMYCINKDSLAIMKSLKTSSKQPGNKRGKYKKVNETLKFSG